MIAAAVLAAFILGRSAGVAALAEAAVPPENVRKLTAGEIIVDVVADPGSNAGLVHAILEIEAPPSAVWVLMLDCGRTMKFNERLKSCRVTSSDPQGRWDIREHIVEWFWPLPKVRSVFRSEYKPFESIRFRKIEGDLRELSGSWTLAAIRKGEATRLTYEARIDPGSVVPGILLRSAMETEIRRVLSGLRREATGHE